MVEYIVCCRRWYLEGRPLNAREALVNHPGEVQDGYIRGMRGHTVRCGIF